MKKIIIYSILIFVFACQKTPVLELNPQKNTKLNITGQITSEFIKHKIRILRTNSILDSIKKGINNASIILKNDSINYTFNHTLNGIYESEIPFQLINDANYELSINYDTLHINSHFKMPDSITISNIFANTDETFNTKVDMKINSSIQQSIIFKMFDAILDSITLDTIWTERLIDKSIYRLNAGVTEINNVFEGYYQDEQIDSIIKFEFYTINNKIADYLLKLKDYQKYQSTTNQYVNPPFYYSKSVLGLVYGTHHSSIIHHF